MSRLHDLFGVEKPVIAMAHVPALPGSPRYERGSGLRRHVGRVAADVEHLLAGGVDGVMFCNEDDRPYSLELQPETLAAMAAIVAELRPTSVPFGVDILWNPMAAIALAKATGASFMREVITGAYEERHGRLGARCRGLRALPHRHRRRRRAGDGQHHAGVRFAARLADDCRARTVGRRVDADRRAVSSLDRWPGPSRTGTPSRRPRPRSARTLPVLMNTGAKIENIASVPGGGRWRRRRLRPEGRRADLEPGRSRSGDRLHGRGPPGAWRPRPAPRRARG